MKIERRQAIQLNSVVSDNRGMVLVDEIVCWFLSDGRCEDDPRDQFLVMVILIIFVVEVEMQSWMLMLIILIPMLMLMIHDHGTFDFRLAIFDSI